MIRFRRGSWLAAGWAGLLLWNAGPAWAASGNADGTYTVTVTKVETTKDGTSFTTLFEGSQDINIAAANAGAVAASLASGVSLAPGTYTQVRVTIGGTLRLKGYVNNGATTIFTNGGADTAAFSTNSSAADTPGGTYAISSFAIPAANRTNTQSVTIIVPAGGSPPTARISFDTSGVITQSGGIPSVGAPSITMTSV